MNAKTYHSISSSEDEQEDYEGVEVTEEKWPSGAMKLKTMNDILSKVKGVKYDFGYITSSSKSILYSNEITKDDEVWLMQAPKDVQPGSFKETELKFKGFSQITLETPKRKRHFNVYTLKCRHDEVTNALPLEKTKSFHMHVHPLTGRIVLQEDFQVDNKDETLSKSILSSSSIISESNINNIVDSQTSDAESCAPSKKKKRKSIKQDYVSN